MIRFFRTRAPFFAILLLAALLATLPGARHPLSLVALVLFVALAWRALSRWRARAPDAASLDDQVARSAAAWDNRYAPPDDIDGTPDDEPWRASLGPTSAWRASEDEDEER